MRPVTRSLSRFSAGAAACAVIALPMGLPMTPSFADDAPVTPSYGGFTTAATATPLRLEVYEPAIPIPASPQAEFNFSYTHVEGSSGPSSLARASALWPGDPIGEGLKTIVTQAGLPAALAGDGYPVQVNAQSPGSPSSQSQEFLPGMTGKATADQDSAIARAGYSTGGDVAGDSSGSGSNLLDTLKSGDLSAIGGVLTGTTSSSGGDSNAPSSPLGALSILVDVGGMSSSARTSYAADSVTATATSQLGELSLLGGLVKLEGFTTTSTTTSKLDGATTTPKVSYGDITIAGTPFAFTSDGLEAAGSTTAIPGLSDNPLSALKQLGISIDLPKPTKTVSGASGTSTADGPTITLDTQPVLSLLALDKLPLGDIINQIPDSAGQAKSLLLAALQAHPKIVIKAGEVSSSAQTVPAIALGGGTTTGTTPTTPTGSTSGSTGASSGGGGGGGTGTGSPTADAPTASGAVPTTTDAIAPVSAVPGLPGLGSVPGMLTIAGIALAAGLGWWLRNGLAAVFGKDGTCAHGLQSGLPDLRKV